MPYHLIVKGISRLYAVDDFALLVVAHARHHGHSLVEIDVEVLVFNFYFLHTHTFECAEQLLVYQFPTFFHCVYALLLVSVFYGPFHVVDDG